MAGLHAHQSKRPYTRATLGAAALGAAALRVASLLPHYALLLDVRVWLQGNIGGMRSRLLFLGPTGSGSAGRAGAVRAKEAAVGPGVAGPGGGRFSRAGGACSLPAQVSRQADSAGDTGEEGTQTDMKGHVQVEKNLWWGARGAMWGGPIVVLTLQLRASKTCGSEKAGRGHGARVRVVHSVM